MNREILLTPDDICKYNIRKNKKIKITRSGRDKNAYKVGDILESNLGITFIVEDIQKFDNVTSHPDYNTLTKKEIINLIINENFSILTLRVISCLTEGAMSRRSWQSSMRNLKIREIQLKNERINCNMLPTVEARKKCKMALRTKVYDNQTNMARLRRYRSSPRRYGVYSAENSQAYFTPQNNPSISKTLVLKENVEKTDLLKVLDTLSKFEYSMMGNTQKIFPDAAINLAVYDNGTPVSFMQGKIGKFFYMGELLDVILINTATSPQYRGKGLVRTMLNIITKKAIEKNIKKLLWTVFEENDTSQKVADKLGFKSITKIDNLIVCMKDISND